MKKCPEKYHTNSECRETCHLPSTSMLQFFPALFEPDLGTRTLAVPHGKTFERSIEERPISSMDSVQSIELYKKYSGIYTHTSLYIHVYI